MATVLSDMASAAILGTSLLPQTISGTTNGEVIDFLHADGPCFAIQAIGQLDGSSPTIVGKIQESADTATWSDISGATFATVTTSETTQLLTFRRSKRYLRWVGTLGGTGPEANVCVLMGAQRKTF